MNDTPLGKKSLGQHWLYHTESLRAMCDAAEVGADDTVLEIGPGLGSLTELLVRRAKKVVAVEFDERLADELPARVPAQNLEVAAQDILRFDFTKLPAGYKVVANIPYYLTSNLIRVLSESVNPPVRAVLLVQKEVAERMAARPGATSLLSVSAQFYWEVSLGRIVPAALFTPPPKVDSQILIMQYREQPLFPDIDTKQFFRLVKAGFVGRRKTLLNSLSAGLQLEKSAARKLLEHAKIQPTLRAQNLALDDWHRLYEAWHELQVAAA
ncbi:MAG TPA: 16S rRNA (adenine(1518)-N(6)/adenine(1519)-N(6))-dimethyltransferase RsmA [Candidatus Saccharimonadales bacterium]|jgi:16S rRNA (adenine1518-N6/adenine1519-N6)-dimethyltransferase